MKKIITSILTVLLVLCLFPSWTVRAQEIESFDVVVNDYYKEKDTVLKLYMESEEIMVSLDDLIKLTGYKSEKNENGFRLYRNGKNVLISNETIIYGNHKEEIKVVEYDEKTLVSLIPTIDFLDARLKMNDDSLVMFRPEMTFSKVLSEMKHDLDIGYMRIKKNNSLGTGLCSIRTVFEWRIFIYLQGRKNRKSSIEFNDK